MVSILMLMGGVLIGMGIAWGLKYLVLHRIKSTKPLENLQKRATMLHMVVNNPDREVNTAREVGEALFGPEENTPAKGDK